MPGYYRVSISIVNKSVGSGKAAAKIAYIMRRSVEDLDTGVTKYSKSAEEDLEAAGIAFPEWMSEEAKQKWSDPAVLAQAVEHAEKKADGQIFRQFIINFNKNLSEEQRMKVMDEICEKFNSEGMFVIYGMHKQKADNGNFHAHLLLPVREFDKDGNFKTVKQKKVYANCLINGKPSYNENIPSDENHRIAVIDPKTGEQKIEKKTGRKCWQRVTIERNPWDDRNNAERWRQMIAEIENKYLSDENKVDWRSYERQGVDKVPKESGSIKEQKMQDRFEKAVDTLSASDQEKWIEAIAVSQDEKSSEKEKKKAVSKDEEFKEKLSKSSRYKPTSKYFGRYSNYGSKKINVETLAISIHEYLKKLAEKIKESAISITRVKKSNDQIRKDVLIIHNFGMTKPMERHFQDAENIIRDRRLEKLENRLKALRKGDILNGEIRHAAAGLIEAIGSSATDAGSNEENREASENYKRFMRTELEVAETIIRCAASLAAAGIENRRSRIRESRAELANQRTRERAAAKERTDRDTLRGGSGVEEGTKIKRKM